MNIEELIDYLPDDLKLKKATIYVYVCTGKIPCIKKGNKLYFDKIKIDAWNKNRVTEINC